MSKLKDDLIRLGRQQPELRKHIVPVVDRISSSDGRGKTSAFMRKGDPYLAGGNKESAGWDKGYPMNEDGTPYDPATSEIAQNARKILRDGWSPRVELWLKAVASGDTAKIEKENLWRRGDDDEKREWYRVFKLVDPFSWQHSKSPFKEASTRKEASMVRIKKRTSLGDLFASYIDHIASELKGSVEGLDEMVFELRGAEDLGFRFTKHDEDGEKITFFADVSFSLAPEYINIDIKGARGSKNFSDKIRMFMTDPARKSVQRIASYLNRQ